MGRSKATPAPEPPAVEDHQGEQVHSLSDLFGPDAPAPPSCITQGHAQAPESVKVHDTELHERIRVLEQRNQNLHDDFVRLQARVTPIEQMRERFEDLRRDLVARQESRKALGQPTSKLFEAWQADVTKAIGGA